MAGGCATAGRRGLRRPRRRDGRHRDALFPGRLARARRRRHGHRLAQPEGVHGRQARPRGALAFSGDAGIGEVRATIEAGCPEPPGGGTVERGRHLRRVPRARAALIDPDASAAARRRRRRQRDGRADGRPAARAPRARPGRPPTGSPTASSRTTSRTHCWPRTAGSSSTRCAPRAPTSGSPGTATPTAASSSTTAASSSTATSSPRCSPRRS